MPENVRTATLRGRRRRVIMTTTDNPETAKLLQAVAAEKEAVASSLVGYKALTAQIAAYQRAKA